MNIIFFFSQCACISSDLDLRNNSLASLVIIITTFKKFIQESSFRIEWKKRKDGRAHGPPLLLTVQTGNQAAFATVTKSQTPVSVLQLLTNALSRIASPMSSRAIAPVTPS